MLARKLLAGTVGANMVIHHTAALHIDACRVGNRGEQPYIIKRWKPGATLNRTGGAWKRDDDDAPTVSRTLPPGRWPTNVLFCHSPDCDEGGRCAHDCPVVELDSQAGIRRSGTNPDRRRSDKFRATYGRFTGDRAGAPARGAETGSAARFFPVFRYAPKARPSVPTCPASRTQQSSRST